MFIRSPFAGISNKNASFTEDGSPIYFDCSIYQQQQLAKASIKILKLFTLCGHLKAHILIIKSITVRFHKLQYHLRPHLQTIQDHHLFIIYSNTISRLPLQLHD